MQKIGKKRLIIIIVCALFLLGCATSLILFKSCKKDNNQIFLEYYNAKVRLFEEQNKSLGKVDIVFIGDSITEGFEVFTKDVYSDYNVCWRGIGGDNTFMMQKRLKVSLFDVNPSLIVMCIGGNNIKTMLDNYLDILLEIKENLPNAMLLVHSIYPTSKSIADRNLIIPNINAQVKKMVEGQGYIFVDVHSHMKDERGELSAIYTEDGAHPNEKGYEVITSVLKTVIDNYFKNNN